MKQPYQSEDGQWYFDLDDKMYGPYPDANRANMDHEWWIKHLRLTKGTCPDCDE